MNETIPLKRLFNRNPEVGQPRSKYMEEVIADLETMGMAQWPMARRRRSRNIAEWKKIVEQAKAHKKLGERLKPSLAKKWGGFPQENVATAIKAWRPRLKLCVTPKGGYCEV
ncbi:hypothetical protein ILUMI_25172 [Ignelater luminosus]|uniref:Uncharacterized protein n=1 Tax=Ignelater luminosus TaxID=2038154 RepID=A0A8K0C7T9_IGNLU|nr:hypothetical protein ILUMI_25172 [Ignelater luminosus]